MCVESVADQKRTDDNGRSRENDSQQDNADLLASGSRDENAGERHQAEQAHQCCVYVVSFHEACA